MEGFRQIQHFALACRLLGPVLLGASGCTGVLTSRGFGGIGRTSNERSKRDIFRYIRLCLSRFLSDWEETLRAGSRVLPREYRG